MICLHIGHKGQSFVGWLPADQAIRQSGIASKVISITNWLLGKILRNDSEKVEARRERMHGWSYYANYVRVPLFLAYSVLPGFRA